MKIDPLYVSSMDPGETTGLALLLLESETFRVLEKEAVTYRPDRGLTPLDTLWKWNQEYSDARHALVFEDFHIRTGVPYANTTALRIIGALEDRLMKKNPYGRVSRQEPIQAKHPVTDATLSEMGFEASGPDARQMRDAFRHAVIWARGWGYAPMFV